MKVILLQNVAKLGNKNDVVDVKPGYAQNFLIPKNFAAPVTKRALEQIEEARKKEAAKREKLQSIAEDLKKTIEGTTIELARMVSESTRLFGSVTEKEIREELSSAVKYNVSAGMLQLKSPIKNTGTYTIPVQLTDSVTAKFKLSVVKEK